MTAKTERRAAARPEDRHRGRQAAVQMLYQWEVGRQPMSAVTDTFWTNGDDADVPASAEVRRFATRLAEGVAAKLEQLDPPIAEAAEHWRIERMNVLDRLVLRLAVYELLEESATPARVIINEALELARTFSGDEAVPFINGVLDAIRRKLQRE